MTKLGPDITVDHVLICEDIRREDNGKQIVIGLFAGDIKVSRLPVDLRLAFLVRGKSSKKGPNNIELRLLDSNNSPIVEGQSELNVQKPNSLFSMSMPPVIVQIVPEGVMKFQMRQPGTRWKTVQETLIKLGP